MGKKLLAVICAPVRFLAAHENASNNLQIWYPRQQTSVCGSLEEAVKQRDSRSYSQKGNISAVVQLCFCVCLDAGKPRFQIVFDQETKLSQFPLSHFGCRCCPAGSSVCEYRRSSSRQTVTCVYCDDRMRGQCRHHNNWSLLLCAGAASSWKLSGLTPPLITRSTRPKAKNGNKRIWRKNMINLRSKTSVFKI